MKNKKESMFTGWSKVYGFTFEQAVKTKSFRLVTIGVALLLFLILGGINVVVALMDREEEPSDVLKVYMVNETTLKGLSNETLQGLQQGIYKNTEFLVARQEEVSLGEQEAMLVLREEEEYILDFYANTEEEISREDAEELLNTMVQYLEQVKFLNLNLDEGKMAILTAPVSYQLTNTEEGNKTIGETMFRMLAPMLFGLLLYMMILIYGQSITKSVLAEKSSKLLEMLLTTVRPYAVIAGKVLAMVSVALVQLFFWIFMGIAGFLIGDRIAQGISPKYHNVIIEVVKVIRNQSQDAFKISSIVLAIIILCIGFFFYCVLAGFAASSVSKAEDLSNAMAVFQMPVIISFLAAYMVPLQENAFATNLVRYIPFTAAFTLPADLLVGNIGIAGSLVALLLLILVTLAAIIVTGKVYKKNVFGK